MGVQRKMSQSKQVSLETGGAHYHTPVLLHESVDALAIQPGGTYVDCTFGGGGHSRAILEKLNNQGRLIAFDQDDDAATNLPNDPRVLFVPHNFRHLQRFLRLHKIIAVDGILADLGVSSHQFDRAERGFSTRYNAALDMRMDRRQPLTAAEVINHYSEPQLHRLFEQYGEVTNARTLARTLVDCRNETAIRTIDELKHALRHLVKGIPQKYFAQVFQALRIEVNDELGALKELLQQSVTLLKPAGRIAIITFHSLEDRIVKNFFRSGSFTEPNSGDVLYGRRAQVPLQPVGKKPVTATSDEIRKNPRSRSAKLRVAEKIENENKQ